MFKIETISNRVVKAGALVTVLSHIIVDAEGQLVSGTKSYDSAEEAQLKIDSMGNLSAGLEFAKSAFPELAAKAQIGKANTVAAYLDWIAAGKPVKEVAAAEEVEAVEPTPAPVADEGEDF